MNRCIALLAGLAATTSLTLAPTTAFAELRAVDQAPAATLLLPYFEVDLNNPNGNQTSFRLINTSASAALANVTLWTDLGVPTQSFPVYLVGYDSQTVDLRLLFQRGLLPVTATDGQDPMDTISPQGPLSQDINFASCNGTLPPAPLSTATLTGLRAAHSGQGSSLFGGQCAGAPGAAGIARGYVTIDSVNSCVPGNPTSVTYQTNTMDARNILTGSYAILNRSTQIESGGALVAVEAIFNGAPGGFSAGQRTFYGGYNSLAATDQREPLGSSWSARYINGGAFNQSTQLVVWRDPGQVVSPYVCGGALPAPFPLATQTVVAFDEEETAINSGASNPFPLVTQRVAASSLSPFSFGYLRLNLNLPAGPGATQSWVQVQHLNQGTGNARYAASTSATVIESTSSLQGCSAPCGINITQ